MIFYFTILLQIPLNAFINVDIPQCIWYIIIEELYNVALVHLHKFSGGFCEKTIITVPTDYDNMQPVLVCGY